MEVRPAGFLLSQLGTAGVLLHWHEAAVGLVSVELAGHLQSKNTAMLKNIIAMLNHIVLLEPTERPSMLSYQKKDGQIIKGISIWAALREKIANVLSRCHTKR